MIYFPMPADLDDGQSVISKPFAAVFRGNGVFCWRPYAKEEDVDEDLWGEQRRHLGGWRWSATELRQPDKE